MQRCGDHCLLYIQRSPSLSPPPPPPPPTAAAAVAAAATARLFVFI